MKGKNYLREQKKINDPMCKLQSLKSLEKTLIVYSTEVPTRLEGSTREKEKYIFFYRSPLHI